jgi:2-haloacid dehalogenase
MRHLWRQPQLDHYPPERYVGRRVTQNPPPDFDIHNGDATMERVFVFDAYGTLFDLESMQPRLEALFPGYGSTIMQLWRLKQLEYSWLRTLMGEPFVDFWTVTKQSLQFALSSAGFILSEPDVEEVASEYHRLKLFPEVRAALQTLPIRCALLSNGSQSMLDALIANADIGDKLDKVISVDAARAFKPHPRCYALVESVLHVAPKNVVFLSSNSFDISGAKRFGFTTVWLNRAPPEDAIAPVNPSQLYRLIRSQPEQLDAIPDYTCASLEFNPYVRRALGI